MNTKSNRANYPRIPALPDPCRISPDNVLGVPNRARRSEASSLVSRMLSPDPAARPSASAATLDAFFMMERAATMDQLQEQELTLQNLIGEVRARRGPPPPACIFHQGFSI